MFVIKNSKHIYKLVRDRYYSHYRFAVYVVCSWYKFSEHFVKAGTILWSRLELWCERT